MTTDDHGHYIVELIYTDALTANRQSAKCRDGGAHSTVVEPRDGRWVMTAWFEREEDAERCGGKEG
jgi:hypothetical protein